MRRFSQGSLLGPLFFIVYINYLLEVISEGSNMPLYADDSKMYRVINTPCDQSVFQRDLDRIYDRCEINKMKVNTMKCKFMRITKKKSPAKSVPDDD